MEAVDAQRSVRNLRNAGNSCYISAVLAACFAQWDGWDGCVAGGAALSGAVRRVVNSVRRGEGAPPEAVEELCSEFSARKGFPPGRGQEDAVEFFGVLLDALGAPFIALAETSVYSGGVLDGGGTGVASERMLRLDLVPGPDGEVTMDAMLAYFFNGEVVGGYRVPDGRTVDTLRERRLITGYTPQRATGEVVPASRESFRTVAVPFVLRRYKNDGKKDRTSVAIPTAIDASAFVGDRERSSQYTLLLKSIVSHLGDSIRSGHYVTYTYDTSVGWKRWDDLDKGRVKSCRGRVTDGAPETRAWRNEITSDAYMVLYELVPGDSDFDASESSLATAEGEAWRGDEGLTAQEQNGADRDSATEAQDEEYASSSSYEEARTAEMRELELQQIADDRAMAEREQAALEAADEQIDNDRSTALQLQSREKERGSQENHHRHHHSREHVRHHDYQPHQVCCRCDHACEHTHCNDCGGRLPRAHRRLPPTRWL